MSAYRPDAVEKTASPGEFARQDREPEKDYEDPGSGENQQKNPADHQPEPGHGDAESACCPGESSKRLTVVPFH
jgi:hypothetical protein